MKTREETLQEVAHAAIRRTGRFRLYIETGTPGLNTPKLQGSNATLDFDPVRIPDLDMGPEAVSASLYFKGVHSGERFIYRCVIPWSSVWAVTGADGMGWASELPQPKKPMRPHLRLVKGGKE